MQNENSECPLGKLHECGAVPKKGTGRGRWKAYFNARSSTSAPPMVTSSQVSPRRQRRFQKISNAITNAATSTYEPMKEKAFIVAVIPGEAKPCTQSRTARSKRRVEPSTISCATKAKNTPESPATARLTSTATSRNTLALGAD